ALIGGELDGLRVELHRVGVAGLAEGSVAELGIALRGDRKRALGHGRRRDRSGGLRGRGHHRFPDRLALALEVHHLRVAVHDRADRPVEAVVAVVVGLRVPPPARVVPAPVPGVPQAAPAARRAPPEAARDGAIPTAGVTHPGVVAMPGVAASPATAVATPGYAADGAGRDADTD